MNQLRGSLRAGCLCEGLQFVQRRLYVIFACIDGGQHGALNRLLLIIEHSLSFARAGFYQILCIALLAQMGYTHNRNS